MEVARPLLLLPLLLPLLLLLAGCKPSAAADCDPSPSKSSDKFKATITWTYDLQGQTCKIQKQGSSSSPTTLRMGESKTIAGLGNDCLYIGCSYYGPWVDSAKSSCFVKEGCCVKMSEVGNKPPSCQCIVELLDNTWPIVPFINNSRSFNVSTQYLCNANQGQGGLLPSKPTYLPLSIYHNAHWPLYPWYPYHPFYPGLYPSHPGYYPGYAGPWAHWMYPPFYSAPLWPYYQGGYADLHNLTGAGTGGKTTPAPTGAGTGGQTTPAPTGCHDNGKTVAEGAVTKSDACRKTVCKGGKLVTQNIGDGNGCAFEPSKLCIKEGSNLTVHEQTTCFTLSCQNNGKDNQPKLTTKRTGCSYDGKCYPGGSQVVKVGSCKTVTCQQNATTEQFSLTYNVTGCLTFDGRCIDVNSKEINDCNETTCFRNASTGDFFLNTTSEACISLTEPYTCRFDHDESDATDNDSCIYNTCKTHPTNRWESHYKNTENCSALNIKECLVDEGIQGCEHNGKCHPVKSVLPWNNCTQFVCYSDDALLNSGNRSNVRPSWEPRALGCYGPPGCMKFGEDFVDIRTNNTYRCGYNVSGLGHKHPQLFLHCAMPSALLLPLGTVVREDLTYYACTRDGMQTLEINQTVPTPGEVADCGRNPVTNETMYPGNRYHWNTAFCEISPNCSKTCTYFDTPCYIDDKETDAKTRAHGETFTVGNVECACTRDNGVNNNLPSQGSRANTPSLCAQDGVRGGACKDSAKNIRQWGELWVRPNTDPLEICTCKAGTRNTFCSVLASNVVNLPITAENSVG